MAARLTKAELTAQLEAALVRANKAEAELASLRSAQQPAPRPARVARNGEPTPFQLACAKARELAMQTGRAVRVG